MQYLISRFEVYQMLRLSDKKTRFLFSGVQSHVNRVSQVPNFLVLNQKKSKIELKNK